MSSFVGCACFGVVMLYETIFFIYIIRVSFIFGSTRWDHDCIGRFSIWLVVGVVSKIGLLVVMKGFHFLLVGHLGCWWCYFLEYFVLDGTMIVVDGSTCFLLFVYRWHVGL